MTNNERVQRPPTVAAQTRDILLDRLRSGVYRLDERMPSEERLAEEFGVSRASVRSALAMLEAEGLLRRRQGDGTYPSSVSLELRLASSGSWEIERQIRARGATPGLRLLAAGFAEEVPGLDADVAGELRGAWSERVLFLADEAPAALILFLASPDGLMGPVPPEAYALPPMEFLRRFQGRKASDVELRFLAVAAGPAEAEALGTAPGAPLLVMRSVVRDAAGRPLAVSREFYPGETGFALPAGLFRC